MGSWALKLKGSWALRLLCYWALGLLGNRALGKLGSWAHGILRSLALGVLGTWHLNTLAQLGSWAQKSKQILIFSSYNNGFTYKAPLFKNFFNLTMTFRQDSDIKLPYGMVIPLPTNNCSSEQNSFQENNLTPQKWLDFNPDDPTVKLKQKPKDIAWLVSHCDTKSGREHIVSNMKLLTSLNIDIYGTCGYLKQTIKSDITSDFSKSKSVFF
jgi:hypothetical protein